MRLEKNPRTPKNLIDRTWIPDEYIMKRGVRAAMAQPDGKPIYTRREKANLDNGFYPWEVGFADDYEASPIRSMERGYSPIADFLSRFIMDKINNKKERLKR